MRILLDENLDRRLRHQLGDHEVFTVSHMGWSGLKNGRLLQTAEEYGIDIFVTGDQTLRYEQNLSGRRLAIVALSAIEMPIIRLHLAQVVAAIVGAMPGSYQAVDCGAFSRKRK